MKKIEFIFISKRFSKNMFVILLFAFIICLILDYIDEGGQFVTFARFVEFTNSFREPTPRKAKTTSHSIVIEYKYGTKLYSLIVPKPKMPLKWESVVAKIGTDLVDATKDVSYVAGPFKDFGGIYLRPEHINSDFQMLFFTTPDQKVIQVNRGETILKKLLKKND